VVEAAFSEKQFFRGKGAGGHPTGSAVLSDISANRYGYGYEYRKAKSKNGTVYTDDVNINVYFRFNELDSFDKLDFISISEKYEGTEGNYVIGEINLQTLKTSEQFKRDDVFLVELPK
jgi:homoserine dehydrogenase